MGQWWQLKCLNVNEPTETISTACKVVLMVWFLSLQMIYSPLKSQSSLCCMSLKNKLDQGTYLSMMSVHVSVQCFSIWASQVTGGWLISMPRRGSMRTFFPLVCCSWPGWHPGLFPPSLSQTKPGPADWDWSLILVFSTWLSPSKASFLLCLMWAFSL